MSSFRFGRVFFGNYFGSENPHCENLQLKMDCCKNNQKTVGYLEKRGKFKFINSWKKYWFVLEGHLLLYYSSKDDYDSLSPCKGSITLVPTCSVKPYTACIATFQIITRSTEITLRAETVSEQTKWMQAILTTLNHKNKSPTKLNHFRYSMERVNLIMNENQTANTIENEGKEKIILDRLQKLGARSYSETFTSFNLDFGKKNLSNEEIPKSPEIVTSTDKLEQICDEKTRKLSKKISLLSEYYNSDNDLYSTPEKLVEKSQETDDCEEIDNDLYESFNTDNLSEDVFENDVYISETSPKKTEDLYSKPLRKSQIQSETTEKELFFECDNEIYSTSKELLYEEPLQENEEEKVDYEEILASKFNDDNIYSVIQQEDEPNDDDDNLNLYEDPSDFLFANKKIKKKSRKLCRHFVQKLLQKHRNYNKKNENCDLKKTLAMLTEIQELLEKKKKILREFSQNVKHCNEDGSSEAECPSLRKSHSEMCNGIDCEEIYSEILTSDRSSKELKEFLGNYFKHDHNINTSNVEPHN